MRYLQLQRMQEQKFKKSKLGGIFEKLRKGEHQDELVTNCNLKIKFRPSSNLDNSRQVNHADSSM